MGKKRNILLFITSFLVSLSAFSATSTATFSVTATVSAACNVAASTLGFGTYNPLLGTNLDVSTTVNVTCTTGSPYNVGLDPGLHSSDVNNRLMLRTAGGTDTITYTLYSNSGHTTVWGNTIGTNTVTGTGIGTAQSLTVYGRILASNPTTIPPASYADTITVTVTF